MVVLLTVTRHTYCIKMCVCRLLAVPPIWRVLRSRKGRMIGFLRGRSDDVTVDSYIIGASLGLPAGSGRQIRIQWDTLKPFVGGLCWKDYWCVVNEPLNNEYSTFHFYIFCISPSHIYNKTEVVTKVICEYQIFMFPEFNLFPVPTSMSWLCAHNKYVGWKIALLNKLCKKALTRVLPCLTSLLLCQWLPLFRAAGFTFTIKIFLKVQRIK